MSLGSSKSLLLPLQCLKKIAKMSHFDFHANILEVISRQFVFVLNCQNSPSSTTDFYQISPLFVTKTRVISPNVVK